MPADETPPEPADERWLSGDWPFHKGEDPDWDDPEIKRLRLREEEYEAVADAVVNRRSLTIGGHEAVDRNGIVRFCAVDLRRLVDAVQSHEDARLARAAEGEDGHRRPIGVFDTKGKKTNDSPTPLVLYGCVIESCKLSSLCFKGRLKAESRFVTVASFNEVRFDADVWLDWARFDADASFAGARFGDDARFDHTHFSAGVSFSGARFDADAWFEEACFTARTTFNGARFGADAWFGEANFDDNAYFSNTKFDTDARFDDARFHRGAWFIEAHFDADAHFTNTQFENDTPFIGSRFNAIAWFDKARFEDDARFNRARFVHDSRFIGAIFGGKVCFSDTEINRRLQFNGATFSPDARLDIAGIFIRAGASLHLDTAQLNITETDSAFSNRLARQEADAVERWANSPFSIRIVFIQYIEAAVIMPIVWMIVQTTFRLDVLLRNLRQLTGSHEIPLGLGTGPRGRLIKGEDSNDKKELAKAAESYNLLRDIFRAQPSTDAHEEICAIRHHDLIRRAKHRPHWWSHIPGFFHWLIMRNALGYLMNPWRPIITGGILLVFFALVYGVGIGPGDISHGAFEPVADGAGGYLYPEAYAYWNHDPLNPLYLSLMTFVTLGYGDFQPAAGWLKLVTGAEGILGVTLLALFTVAWGRKMVR